MEQSDSWLRWELMKLFSCSVDSDIIKDINPAQMLWYAFMLNKQREEEFDANLNMTEYLASFINYEAVRQTKEARDMKTTVPDEEFEKTIRKRFGKDLSPDLLKRATRMEADEAPAPKMTPKKKGEISIDDLKKYTGLELDEITYIPKK